MDELKDTEVRVSDSVGGTMTLVIPWEADLDAWEGHLKTILTFMGFSVDEVDINPESDDPQEREAREDTIND